MKSIESIGTGWNDFVSLAGIFLPEVHRLKGRAATY